MTEERKETGPAPTAAEPQPAAQAAQPPIVLPKGPEGTLTLRVNGKDHFVNPRNYRSLIEALRALGYDIPHFCYHPGLSPDGNCRMCYVNQIDATTGKPIMAPNLAFQPAQMYPKPIISCREPLNPKGMIVETETPAVVEARKWVMEFLLINHPLDCPVCDKAGECMLQDHSFQHGKADSRFFERKNEQAPKDLGYASQPHGIRLWTDRCIKCTRCTRFLDEISGTSELCFINRGDHTELDIMPGHPVDNPLMGNIVDICPVGALIDRDLMHTYRAWYLRKTHSVCPDCSKGCNIFVEAQNEFVRRLRPRENRDVNDFWMCDYGRHDIGYSNDTKRIVLCKVDGTASMDVNAVAKAVGAKLAERAKADPQSVAGLASAWLTLEEMHLFRQLFVETLHAPLIGLLARPRTKDEVFPKFTIEADKNPNRAGAQLIFGPDVENTLQSIIDGINAGRIKTLYIVAGVPHFEPPAELVAALAKLEYLVVQDLFHGPLTEKAHVVLPSASFVEKDGVFVNSRRRAQVLRRAIDPLAQGHDDLSILQRVLKAAGASDVRLSSAQEVFRQMSKTCAGIAELKRGSGG
jgi:NADH-quinone oxidoreductase subunit G